MSQSRSWSSGRFRLWRDLRTRLRSLEVTKRNQGVLDEIADLRERLIRLRIEMQKDAPKKSPEEWAAIYHDLENQIAKRIELFASHAEAVNCRARGNITRRTGDVPPHQLYIDLCRWRTKDRTGGREVARQSAKRTSGLIALSPLPR